AWVLMAMAIIALDLFSKDYASTHLVYGDPVPVLSFFNLTLLHNTGAAFSFLADAGGWQKWVFAIIAVGVSGALLVWMYLTPARLWWLKLSQAFIIAGALGNLHDRLMHGYVVDFISLYYGQYYFPAFNVADMAITGGAILLVVDSLFLESARKKNEQSTV
ncbi:MAG: signal peptidase II, partial [Pontibacterium sp.]